MKLAQDIITLFTEKGRKNAPLKKYPLTKNPKEYQELVIEHIIQWVFNDYYNNDNIGYCNEIIDV